MIINKSNLADLQRGFKMTFQSAFEGAPSDWEKLATKVISTSGEEKYPWLGQTTRFREWLGDRVIQNLMTYDYTIKNKPFENTIGVNRDDIEDDRIGVYAPLIQQMGMDAKQHPDELCFALWSAGFTTTCYDGQYFFDTDHPVLDANGVAQSVSNYGGGAGTPWYLIDDTRAIKPMILQMRREYQFVAMDKVDDENVFSKKEFRYGVDARLNVGFGLWQLAYGSKQTLNEANYNTAYSALQSMKGDNGKPLGIRPSLLIVPPSLREAALKIVTAETINNGERNVNQNSAKVLVSPWLA